MKLSPIQIAASAVGAVAAAVIASFFGVQGTIIGVAIGSVVATTASSFAGQSIERTHKAVRHALVTNADQMSFLRRGKQTSAAGELSRAEASATVDAEIGSSATSTPSPGAVAGVPRARARGPSGVGTTRFLASSRTGTAAVTPQNRRDSGRRPRLRWHTAALSAVIVFAAALAVVTVLEVAAGQPLSSLVGGNDAPSGTSAGNMLTSTPPPTTAPTTSAPSSTSTSTSAPRATTTTTTVNPTTTTTTVNPTTTTATTSPASAPSTGG